MVQDLALVGRSESTEHGQSESDDLPTGQEASALPEVPIERCSLD